MKNKLNKIFNIINKNKYSKFIFIGIGLLIIILLILLLVFFFKNDDSKMYEKLNEQNKNIVVSDTYKEKPGTLIRSLGSLREEHCKDDVCIKNVIIYYIKDEGRIEYEITNKSKKKVSGAFKLEFDNGNTTYVVYNKLKKKETRKGLISFTNTDYSNVYDYTLKKVKDDELKKLLNKK